MSTLSPKNIMLWIIMISFYLMPAISMAEPTTTDKTTLNDINKQMEDVTKAISSYSMNQRDEAVKQVKESLDTLDAEIERMEDRFDKKIDKMDQAARQKTRAALKSLRKHRNEVARWYGNMQQSSAEAWHDVKTGFLKSYHSLQESFDKAQKEF